MVALGGGELEAQNYGVSQSQARRISPLRPPPAPRRRHQEPFTPKAPALRTRQRSGRDGGVESSVDLSALRPTVSARSLGSGAGGEAFLGHPPPSPVTQRSERRASSAGPGFPAATAEKSALGRAFQPHSESGRGYCPQIRGAKRTFLSRPLGPWHWVPPPQCS